MSSPVPYVELNMCNYDEDQVAQLNEWAIWAYGVIEAALEAKPTPPDGCDIDSFWVGHTAALVPLMRYTHENHRDSRQSS